MPLLNRKVQLAFGSAVLTLLVTGWMSYRAIAVSSEGDRWVRHTHEVLETLEDLLSTMRSIESSNHGFALTGNESFLGSYTSNVVRLGQEEATLRKLTADTSEGIPLLSLAFRFCSATDVRAAGQDLGPQLSEPAGPKASGHVESRRNSLLTIFVGKDDAA